MFTLEKKKSVKMKDQVRFLFMHLFIAVKSLFMIVSLQRSDHRYSFGSSSWFDILPRFVLPGSAVPQRPRHPPQKSHETIPGEWRGEARNTFT